MKAGPRVWLPRRVGPHSWILRRDSEAVFGSRRVGGNPQCHPDAPCKSSKTVLRPVSLRSGISQTECSRLSVPSSRVHRGSQSIAHADPSRDRVCWSICDDKVAEFCDKGSPIQELFFPKPLRSGSLELARSLQIKRLLHFRRSHV